MGLLCGLGSTLIALPVRWQYGVREEVEQNRSQIRDEANDVERGQEPGRDLVRSGRLMPDTASVRGAVSAAGHGIILRYHIELQVIEHRIRPIPGVDLAVAHAAHKRHKGPMQEQRP